MIVLHELVGSAEIRESVAVVGLNEKTASIAKNLGTKFTHAGERGFNSLHGIRAPAKRIVMQANTSRNSMTLSAFVRSCSDRKIPRTS
jgi:hypothetical protein